MFTGIVETTGTVDHLEKSEDSVSLHIQANLKDIKVGDSVAVDGVCLTVTELNGGGFVFGLAPETLRRTTLGGLGEGDRVNLERALRAGDPMGGHYVQGHVDAVGHIVRVIPEGDSLVFTFQAPIHLMPYIVEKGFVCIDGISLTVTARKDDHFSIALVAYTQQVVALAAKKPGERVNLEVDIIAKYVESLLAQRFELPGS